MAMPKLENNFKSITIAEVKETRLKVRQIIIQGSTIFSQEELNKIVAPYFGKSLTIAELLEVRTQLTQIYVNRGYITSGAFLPPQELSSGVILMQIIEGYLEKIEVKGLKRLKEDYVRNRLLKAADKPLNVYKLEDALKLLQRSPLFENIQAQLKLGFNPNGSILIVTVTEAPAFFSAIQIDNSQLPSLGEWNSTITVGHQNLFGIGDTLAADYQLSEGLNKYSIAYSIPVNVSDGTLSIVYENSNASLIEPPFSDLNIRFNAKTVSLSFRQPVYQSVSEELILSLQLDWRKSQSYIFTDVPFSFTEGADDGLTELTVLRFNQGWISRNPNTVIAVFSQFNFGLPIFGTPVNTKCPQRSRCPSVEFFSWLGEFQWLEKLNSDTVLKLGVRGQFSNNSLFPIEQFEIGGFDTVRGYRNSLYIGDNGIVVSAEIRFDLFNDPKGSSLELTPFLDFGTVWNSSGGNINPSTITSTGVALRWQFKDFLEATFTIAIPLTEVGLEKNSLQEQGFLFFLKWKPIRF